jgi:hypothetical protein
MESDKIKKLIERYEAGETSIEEENTLSQYFANENIPAEWAPYQLIFQWRTETRKVTLPEDFSVKIASQLRDKPQPSTSHTTRIFNMRTIATWAAAAAVTLAIGFWFFKDNNGLQYQEEKWAQQETFENPEEAYEQTREALAFLSSKLQKGQNEASRPLSKLKELDKAIPGN